ncbi:MAG TPA: glycosyltransferase family 4 protein [Phycisphaerae bacterium]|nr:glycosyltransferase family 4 protein [Phycisphaerae bacterium]HRW52972.1 glycosyltransferase family 4 protein [Phycisphaerae bacterium]
MRLLYVCSDFGIRPDGVKGASIHLRAITRGLSDLGHDVRVLSPHAGPGDNHPAGPLLEPDALDAVRHAGIVKRWLRDHAYDDTAGNAVRPLIYNAMAVAPALSALGAWRPDVIIERLSLYGHVGADIAAALQIPHIVEVNAILSEEARAYRSLEFSQLAEAIEQRTLRQADAIIVVSEALAERVALMDVSRNRIHVVPNGYDPQLFEGLPSRSDCAEEFGVDGAFVVGFSGSLKAWHGVDILIDAFARMSSRSPSSRLLIVGTGPTESQLREQASRLPNGESVVFTGALSHSEVPRALRAMDVAVAPFRSQERFYFSPIKLFEYMASGACVVASRLGQICDVIEDGGDGLLCEPDSVEALAATLIRLSASAEMRHRLASRAARRVHERFTWGHAARRTEDVIHQAILRRATTRTVEPVTAAHLSRIAS